MQCGLVEINKEELQTWWEHPGAKVQSRLFDVFDGAQPGLGPFGPVTRSPDGKLWFASGIVLQTIDPDHLASNTVLPPVHVEGVVADHRNYPLQDGLRLPPLTRDVEVDYTALSFMAPQKVRFRYKLEGRDTCWQDARNPPPGLLHRSRPGKVQVSGDRLQQRRRMERTRCHVRFCCRASLVPNDSISGLLPPHN